jgi:hypothetical protein
MERNVPQENLNGSTWVMIFVQIESSDINKIFQARHHNIEHDFRRKKNLKLVS